MTSSPQPGRSAPSREQYRISPNANMSTVLVAGNGGSRITADTGNGNAALPLPQHPHQMLMAMGMQPMMQITVPPGMRVRDCRDECGCTGMLHGVGWGSGCSQRNHQRGACGVWVWGVGAGWGVWVLTTQWGCKFCCSVFLMYCGSTCPPPA